MFIRLFAETNNENEAINVYKKVMDEIKEFIINENIIKIEPYWKIEDIFVIEAQITLLCETNSRSFTKILNCISDKWLFFGVPVNEALASVNTEECNYIIDGVNMINIFY